MLITLVLSCSQVQKKCSDESHMIFGVEMIILKKNYFLQNILRGSKEKIAFLAS